ncbi:hypothetical protein FRB99_003633 [Tulasnella sp. 403]|nr:hypothetical protein FRB99_003633 [Tulasnella sp. 403]
MTVYNLSTVFNVVKAVMGFKTSEPTWSMVVPESAAVRASQRFSRVLIFPNHENHEDDASIMHHSPEGFTYLDLNQDLTPEEQRAEEEEHLVNTELPTGSTTSSVASVGNGHLRPEAHALLKGSPKALGWEVDEENEENAWVLLMSDAMRSSVFENIEDENEASFRKLTE